MVGRVLAGDMRRERDGVWNKGEGWKGTDRGHETWKGGRMEQCLMLERVWQGTWEEEGRVTGAMFSVRRGLTGYMRR